MPEQSTPIKNRYWLTLSFGLVFGVGFLAGFLTSSARHPQADTVEMASPIIEVGDGVNVTVESKISIDQGLAEADRKITSARNIGFILEEHALGEDEDGLYITGVVSNRTDQVYNSVSIVFELCDSQGETFNTVTDMTREPMLPDSSWGFTIYIPYSEMSLFASYRLQNIMGVQH